MEEKFEDAIQFSKEYPMDSEECALGNRPLLPYCYYRIGQPEQCLRSIDEFNREDLTDDDAAFHSLLKAILDKDQVKVELIKQKMVVICCKQLNWTMLMVLYQLLISYYKSENKTDLLIEAYECKDKVYQHILPIE